MLLPPSHQMAPVKRSTASATIAEKTKVPAMTNNVIMINFQPIFAKSFKSLPREIPANAPMAVVGAKNATFFKEQTSLSKAGNIVEMVWSTARNLGYGRYFINATGGAITDDHEYVIKGRNIPCIDIINYDPDSKSGFGWYWHTQKDNMENIDRETLKAVGQTVLEVVYNRQKK